MGIRLNVRPYVAWTMVLVVLRTVQGRSFAQDTKLNLDASNGPCSTSSRADVTLGYTDTNTRSVFNVPTFEMVNVSSKGNINNANGSCTLSFMVVPTSKCNQICVNTTMLQITNDVVSVMFTPSLAMTQGMNCTNNTNLQLTLKQTSVYTTAVRNGGQKNFTLQFVVSPNCMGNDPSLVIQSNEDLFRNPVDNKEYIIHGVVTGVMLAVFWLIMFFIFRCYYKHNAFGGKRFYMEPVEHNIDTACATEQIQMTNMPQSSKGGAAADA